MNPLHFPYLGDGVALRAVHYPYLHGTASAEWGVDWFEIISEDFFDGRGRILERICTLRPVVMHGVGLSIGGTDDLDEDYLRKLVALQHRVAPIWISDHLCWTGLGDYTTYELLPVARTRTTLAHITARVHRVQDILGVPLVLENPSSYLEFTVNEMTEPEFFTQLTDATGCGLVLDLNNVLVSATNHDFDPVQYLDAFPLDSVVYIHVAGNADHGNHRIDTHDRAVDDKVWELYRYVWELTGRVATLLEWDTDIPPFPQLVAELGKAKDARGQ